MFDDARPDDGRPDAPDLTIADADLGVYARDSSAVEIETESADGALGYRVVWLDVEDGEPVPMVEIKLAVAGATPVFALVEPAQLYRSLIIAGGALIEAGFGGSAP